MKGNSYQVAILSEGVPIPEYGLASDRELYRCYIPSEVGKRFIVDVVNLFPDYDIEARIFIDGRLLARTAVKRMSHNWADGAQVKNNVIRPFVFSDVVLTDDETVANPDQVNLQHLGSIEVHILRVVVQDEQLWDGEMYYQDIGPIHERSKKAGAHQVLLGDQEMASPVEYATVSRIDQPHTPYAKFIFYYRSKELLQAENIIPYSTNIPPLKSIEPFRLQNPPPSSAFRKRTSMSFLDDDAIMLFTRALHRGHFSTANCQTSTRRVR